MNKNRINFPLSKDIVQKLIDICSKEPICETCEENICLFKECYICKGKVYIHKYDYNCLDKRICINCEQLICKKCSKTVSCSKPKYIDSLGVSLCHNTFNICQKCSVEKICPKCKFDIRRCTECSTDFSQFGHFCDDELSGWLSKFKKIFIDHNGKEQQINKIKLL